jgi:hypothetical protein
MYGIGIQICRFLKCPIFICSFLPNSDSSDLISSSEVRKNHLMNTKFHFENFIKSPLRPINLKLTQLVASTLSYHPCEFVDPPPNIMEPTF